MKKQTSLPFDMEDVLIALKNSDSVKQKYSEFKEKIYALQSKDIKILVDHVTIADMFSATDVSNCIEKLQCFISLLPKETLQRKHLNSISLVDTHWFRKGSNYGNLFNETIFPNGPLTKNIDEAASKFSLPWGYAQSIDGNPYNSDMTLYMLIDTYPMNLLYIYFAYTFFHESGHVYSDAAYYSLYYAKKFLGLENIADKRNTYTLTLPNGDQISGNEYVSSFATLAEKYGPFGSYTAGYNKDDDAELWLRESFADATAAYFMGFMMYPEKEFASLDPEVKQYMHDFYHAVATISRH